MPISRMVKYGLSLLVSLGLAAYCTYATAFYAWLATAPASDSLHARARTLSDVWSIGALVSLACAGVILWRMIRLSKARKHLNQA